MSLGCVFEARDSRCQAVSSKLQIELNEGLYFPSWVEQRDLLLVVVVVVVVVVKTVSVSPTQDARLCLPS